MQYVNRAELYEAKVVGRDVDPDWLNSDPDPQNLMNSDPDRDPVRIQVNKISKLISKHIFKVKKKFLFLSLNLNLRE